MTDLVEQNAILYYADYIALRDSSTTVTDNCKYYFIHNSPINSAYIVDSQPFFSTDNPYYQQAKREFELIKNKYDTEGYLSFVDNLCNLAALGVIDARNMLQCMHKYSSRHDRTDAFRRYDKWINSQKYTHLVRNDNGDLERVECTKYVAHAEQNSETEPQVEYVSGLRKR